MKKGRFWHLTATFSAIAVALGGCSFRGNLHTAARTEESNIGRVVISARNRPHNPLEMVTPDDSPQTSRKVIRDSNFQLASWWDETEDATTLTDDTSAWWNIDQQHEPDGQLAEAEIQQPPPEWLSDLAEKESIGTEVALIDIDDIALQQLPTESRTERYPIDLPTSLRLAGADNWNIQLAEERVQEALARYLAAKVLWLPSLNAGIGYNKHDGQIQSTLGPVVDVSRNSLFVGGGAVVSGAPITGASGGPARFFVDLSLADAIFRPLAALQMVRATEARESATFNDTLLVAALAYFDLVESQGLLGVAKQNLKDAERLQRLTQAFVSAGKGSQADIARARVETSNRQQDVIQMQMAVQIAAAELVRVLQLDADKLDPNTALVARESQPVPLELVPRSAMLSALIAQAQETRPELDEHLARIASARQQLRTERYRPYIPNIHLGASAGGFGGGVNDELSQLDGRGDFDILAIWEIKNLGMGNRAAKNERKSQLRQAFLSYSQARDQITAEVTKAYHQVQAQHQRMGLAETNVKQAAESYRRNLSRIQGLVEGLPLEALQALSAVATARQNHLSTIAAYNRAQALLLRAIGKPISTGEEPTPE